MVHKRMKIASVAAIAILLAMTCICVPLNEQGDTIIETDDSDAELVTAILIVSVIILAAIAAYEYYVIKTDDPGADTTAALREAAANNVISQIYNALQHDKAYATDEPDLIGFTSSYFQRMAEVVAAELWSDDSDMDFNSILLESTALDQYSMFMLNRMNVVNQIFESFENKESSWNSSSTYSSMSVSLKFGSVEMTSSGQTSVQYCLGAAPTSGHDQVYLYNGDDENDGFLYSSSSSSITNTDTGTSYTIASGYNSIANIPSGVYTLQDGVTYMGSMMRTYSSGYASVLPSVVLNSGSSNAYVLQGSDGLLDVVYNGSVYNDVSGISYKVSYNDTSQSVDLGTGLDIIQVLNNASNLIFSDVLNAASAAWTVFDSLGEASVFVSPSSLMPNLENMDFTADQTALIYISALQQMSDKFADGATTVTAEDITISDDSLDLVCYGTIYSDNTMTTETASDVYFTPMCYLRDQAVVIGDTAWMQPGLAMLWTKNSDGTYSAAGLVTLESGNYISITSMEYRDTAYTAIGDGITLHVMSLTRVSGYDVIVTPDPEPDPSSTDWLLIGLIIAAIIGLLIAIFVDDLRIFGIAIVIICIIIYGIVYWLPSLSIWDFLKFTGGS